MDHRGYNPWVYLPEYNELWLACAKGGTQSVNQLIAKRYGIELPEHTRHVRRFLEQRLGRDKMQWMDVRGAGELRNADAYQLVADPQKRFESLWKNKSRDHGPGVNPDIYDLSPQELLEYVVQNPYTNRHWAPQHINRVPHGMLIPLENFSEHRHTSTGEVPEYDLVALMQHYEEDNWLREEALDKGEAYDVTRTGASVTT